jgi:LacI family transcriptional regulator
MPLETKAKTPRIPKYVQFARQLREQIERGERKPGEQLPTFAQMQAEFGLGQGTMERVYQLLEEQGLIARKVGHGTFVTDSTARAKSGTIGMITYPSAEQHPYYAHLLRGVREAAYEAGWELLLTHDKAPIKWEKMDGVLNRGAFPLPPYMPYVALMNPALEVPSVTTDDYQGMRLAVEHLLELGHRRIAYMTLEKQRPMISIMRNRLQGYRDALSEAGITPRADWLRDLRGPFEPMREWEVMSRQKTEYWLQSDWEETACTAVIAHNDEAAIGIVEALQDAGLRVPEDISVVGFDGTEIAAYFRPRLTTVEVPLREIGARATRLLIEQMTRPLGEPAPPIQSVVLPPRLRTGQSTALVKA